MDPILKRKLEEHPEIHVIEKCTFTIFWIFTPSCARVKMEGLERSAMYSNVWSKTYFLSLSEFWLSQKSVYYCVRPLKTMAFSRYCVISLLQFMTSLKVTALETLFLLLMKHMLTIKAPHFSPSGTISQENLSILQSDEFCCYCFFCDDGNGTLLSCRSKNLDKHISE